MKNEKIHIDGIRFAAIEHDSIATNIVCSCFSGSLCEKSNKHREICRMYKITATRIKKGRGRKTEHE